MMCFPKYEEHITPEQREKINMFKNAKLGVSPSGGTGRLIKKRKAS